MAFGSESERLFYCFLFFVLILNVSRVVQTNREAVAVGQVLSY